MRKARIVFCDRIGEEWAGEWTSEVDVGEEEFSSMLSTIEEKIFAKMNELPYLTLSLANGNEVCFGPDNIRSGAIILDIRDDT